MEARRIVFLDRDSLGDADVSQIESLGAYTDYGFTRSEEVIERCREAEIVITNKVVISAECMDRLPKLRMIAIAATGMNNVDLDAAAARGITVRNVAGYSTTSVAESTIGLALSLLRNIPYYDSHVKSGAYSAQEQVFHLGRSISNIHGKQWGIIGLGSIGHEVARLATAFGARVSYYSTSGVDRREPYERMDLGELLSTSDVVSIHSPLNDHTRGLIGSEELAAMKPSAVIINVARGGIIDETALASAIDRRVIAGAALDVFSTEPLRDSALYSIADPSRIIFSPHTAWAADDAVRELVGGIAGNIREYIQSHQ